jgi:hypothetical protein
MREYNTPEETFEYLREVEIGSEEYQEASGYLFEYMAEDTRSDRIKGLEVVRLLEDGEVDQAEELVYNEL